MDTKNLTLRIPIDLWKRLNVLRIQGKIESIQQAAIESLERTVAAHSKKERTEEE